jgi:hypothetical protein
MKILTSALTVALVSCTASQLADEPTGKAVSPLVLIDHGGSVTLAAGNNNDWSNLSLCDSTGVCLLVGDASGSTLTGIDESIYGARDNGLWFYNDGTVPITIANNSTASTLNNRIHTRTGLDTVLMPGYGLVLWSKIDWTTMPYTAIGWNEITDNSISSVTPTTPTRSLGTAFQPNVGRPVYACYTVKIDTVLSLTGGQEGRAEILSDAANPPTIIRGAVFGRNTGTVVVGVAVTTSGGGQLCLTVRPGDYVLVRSVNVTGTPTYTLTNQVEDVL